MNQQNEPAPAWLFIVNPAAGGGKVRQQWEKLEGQLRSAHIPFSFVFSSKKRHAIALAKEAVEQGCRHLVAVGGDGTANEVVNGIMEQTACPPEEVAFTILPIGTGNDWIREYRIPKNFNRWLRFFQNSQPTYQDVGWLTFHQNGQQQKRYFINVAGLSYDAFLAKKAEAYMNRPFNKFMYLLLILRCLFQFKIPKIRLTYDGHTVEDYLYTINLGACRYSGGGLRIVPQAVPDDGKLALTFVRRISKLEVMLIMPLFYTGKIGWHPAVSLYQAAEIFVEGDNVLVEADGEFLGETPVRFGVAEKVLKVLVPGKPFV